GGAHGRHPRHEASRRRDATCLKRFSTKPSSRSPTGSRLTGALASGRRRPVWKSGPRAFAYSTTSSSCIAMQLDDVVEYAKALGPLFHTGRRRPLASAPVNREPVGDLLDGFVENRFRHVASLRRDASWRG